MAAATNLVTELETAFQSCLALLTSQDLTQSHLNLDIDQEEIKNNVDQAIRRFLDAVKQLDCFFIQKRALLSAAKPELCINMDLAELQSELQRKDALILKHYDRVQQMLKRMSGDTPTTSQGHQGQTGPQPGGPTTYPQGQVGPAGQVPRHEAVTPILGQQQGGGAFNQGPLAYLEQTTSNIGQSRPS